MNTSLLLTAFEPEVREQILSMLRSDDLKALLGYSATKQDAARKIAQNDSLSSQIELTLTYEPFDIPF